MKNILKITSALFVLSTSAIAENSFPSIHAAIAGLREGASLSDEKIEKCKAEKEAYFEALSAKYNTTLHTQFGTQERINFYMLMIKMALIDFDTNQGWPFRYALRFHVARDLEARTARSKDPWEHFCAIFSSLSRHKVDHAIKCQKFLLQHDPFLAEVAATWVAEHLSESQTKTAFLNAVKQ